MFRKKKKKNTLKVHMPSSLSRHKNSRKRKSFRVPKEKQYSSGKILRDNISYGDKNRFIRIFFLFILGTLFFGFGYFFMYSQFFQVKYITIARENLFMDSAEINTSLAEFYGENIFLLSTSHISQVIQTNFPIVSGVKVNRNFPDTLKVEVMSYPIVANVRIAIDQTDSLLSDDTIVSESGLLEQKGLINERGYMVALGKESLQLPEILLVDRKNQVGLYDQVIRPDHLKNIFQALKIVDEKLNVKIQKIEYYLYGREIHLYTENNTALWIDFTQTPESQLDKLVSQIANFDLENDPPEYFDLRIKNRLIYK